MSIGALLYLIAWTISMGRAWHYHDYFLHVMKEHETFLQLGRFATLSRGENLANGGVDYVGGRSFKFGRAAAALTARRMELATAIAFGLGYILIAWLGISHILSLSA